MPSAEAPDLELLETLVTLNIIGEDQKEGLMRESRRYQYRSVGEYLVDSGFVREHELRVIRMISTNELSLSMGQSLLLAGAEEHSRLRVRKLSQTDLNPLTSAQSKMNRPIADMPESELTDDTLSYEAPSGPIEPDLAETGGLEEQEPAGAMPATSESSAGSSGSESEKNLSESEERLARIENLYRKGARLSGQRIGKYALLRPLGRGASSWVFLAAHEVLDVPLAVKVLHPSLALDKSHALDRFKREALLLMKLNHPGIVRVSDFDFIQGYYLMAMDYVNGLSVSDLIETVGRLREATALRIACQVVESLRAAYRLYIVHRDIKPSNMIIDREGQVRLTDFGLARWVDGPRDIVKTRFGAGLGTPFYCAPEQSEDAGSADFPADIYALGASLYHMLTGRPPFTGRKRTDVLQQHSSQKPTHPRVHNPKISDDTSTLLLSMLQKKPEERPASHLELLSQLHVCIHRLQSQTGQTAELPKPVLPAREH